MNAYLASVIEHVKTKYANEPELDVYKRQLLPYGEGGCRFPGEAPPAEKESGAS